MSLPSATVLSTGAEKGHGRDGEGSSESAILFAGETEVPEDLHKVNATGVLERRGVSGVSRSLPATCHRFIGQPGKAS